MQVIDLRLSDKMEVVRYIPAQRGDLETEFDYPNFPYISYDVVFDQFIGKQVHWHWHRAFQFFIVISGTIRLRSNASQENLNPGDICFINHNANHALEPISKPEECKIHAFTFDPDLLCGNYESALATRYIHPIMKRHELNTVRISAENAAPFREHLELARAAMSAKEFGFEFEVRHQLTLTWLALLNILQMENASIGQQDLRLRDRMRTMLNFIRTNYTRKIDLDEIAESAMISQRECFRCFQRAMGTTPTHYLQNFRVHQAAHMLLETDNTVADIAQDVGFNDTSYFGKTFQKYMKCSPTEFRKNHRGQYTNLDSIQDS